MAAIFNRYMGHPFRATVVALKVVFAAHVFMEYFYEVTATRGASMLPTFHVYGDILVSDRHYRRGRDIKVGDVVTFKSVYEPGEGVLKRVIGMPGDYVMRDSPGSGSDVMIQVPQGHCWVVGDNMHDSLDSRLWGPLPLGLIKGKVIYKAFPWKERHWVENTLQKPEAALD